MKEKEQEKQPFYEGLRARLSKLNDLDKRLREAQAKAEGAQGVVDPVQAYIQEHANDQAIPGMKRRGIVVMQRPLFQALAVQGLSYAKACDVYDKAIDELADYLSRRPHF